MTDGDQDDHMDDLRTIIANLRTEVEEKTKHILRLKRQSVTFAEEASNSEDQLMSDIEKQNLIIKELKLKIAELTHSLRREKALELKSAATQTGIIRSIENDTQTEPSGCDVGSQSELSTNHTGSQTDSYDEDRIMSDINNERIRVLMEDCKQQEMEIMKLKDDVNELNALNRNMITTIEVISAEKEMFATKVKELHSVVSELSPKSLSQYDVLDNTCNNTYINLACKGKDLATAGRISDSRITKKRKVLVYGDGSARNYSTCLRRIMDTDVFDIGGVVLSGAPLSELSRNIFKSTASFDHNDYVIVMLDLTQMRFLQSNELNSVLAIGRFTNIILCYKFDYNVGSKRVFSKFNDCFTEFKNRNINNSIQIVQNWRYNSKYRFNYSSLCKLVASYIYNSSSGDSHSGSGIVLRTITAVDFSNFHGGDGAGVGTGESTLGTANIGQWSNNELSNMADSDQLSGVTPFPDNSSEAFLDYHAKNPVTIS